jgi:hypothetical protein
MKIQQFTVKQFTAAVIALAPVLESKEVKKARGFDARVAVLLPHLEKHFAGYKKKVRAFVFRLLVVLAELRRFEKIEGAVDALLASRAMLALAARGSFSLAAGFDREELAAALAGKA